MQLSCKDKQECISCQSKADWLKLGLWGARSQINEGKDTEFSFFNFFFFLCIALKRSLWGLQYVTLHFNAFSPPDGLDKDLIVSFVQMVSYRKCLFLIFLPQGLDLTFFFQKWRSFH